MKLKDKVAVITGAASGIGATTAGVFAQEGAALSLWDVNLAGLEQMAQEIERSGGKVLTAKVDVADSQAIQAAVDATMERFGKIDILINNAGLVRDTISWKMTDDQWNLVIDVNLKSAFNCCRAIVPIMRKQRYGKIVNTASVALLGNPGQINYSAAKAGISALTRTLALEVGSHGINVNCVVPGTIATAGLAALPSEALKKLLEEKIALRRPGQPEEVAKLHVFLTSDDSSYITGQSIFIDGGLSVGV